MNTKSRKSINTECPFFASTEELPIKPGVLRKMIVCRACCDGIVTRRLMEEPCGLCAECGPPPNAYTAAARQRALLTRIYDAHMPTGPAPGKDGWLISVDDAYDLIADKTPLGEIIRRSMIAGKTKARAGFVRLNHCDGPNTQRDLRILKELVKSRRVSAQEAASIADELAL